MRNDLFRALMADGAIILCSFGAAEHACAQAISDAPAQADGRGCSGYRLGRYRRHGAASPEKGAVRADLDHSVSGQTLEDSGFTSPDRSRYVVPGVRHDPTQGAAFDSRRRRRCRSTFPTPGRSTSSSTTL